MLKKEEKIKMRDYQKRMVEEYKELNTKIDKLTIFLSKEDIPKEITATQITLMNALYR